MLFDTYLCDGKCKVGIYLVDPDSAKITEFVTGLSAPRGPGSYFTPSPDGQYLLVSIPGLIDPSLNLYAMDGKAVRLNIINGWANWLPDSSGLIERKITLDSNYSIFRHTFKDNQVEQLSFDPPVMFSENACTSISPDGKWMLYQDHQSKRYIGNLSTVKSQAYAWDSDCFILWSADSQHFASHFSSQIAIGSVDGTLPINFDGRFIAWLDATHYLFSKGKNIIDLQTYIAEVGKESAAAQTNFIWSPVYALLP